MSTCTYARLGETMVEEVCAGKVKRTKVRTLMGFILRLRMCEYHARTAVLEY